MKVVRAAGWDPTTRRTGRVGYPCALAIRGRAGTRQLAANSEIDGGEISSPYLCLALPHSITSRRRMWSITLPAVIGRRLQAGTYRHRKVTRKIRTE